MVKAVESKTLCHCKGCNGDFYLVLTFDTIYRTPTEEWEFKYFPNGHDIRHKVRKVPRYPFLICPYCGESVFEYYTPTTRIIDVPFVIDDIDIELIEE